MWMNMYMYMLLISSFLFTSFYQHLLLALISLEFMLINLLMSMYMTLLNLNMNFYIITFFIGVMICESVMGLSIMVYMIRNSGNDYITQLSLLKW